MDLTKPIFGILIAFAMGSIPTALILGRLKGIDIRQYGSGNVGATNAFRVLGKQFGITCLVFDILKGFLPVRVLLPVEIFAPAIHASTMWPVHSWAWLIGLAAIAGHMFSPFLKFKGGKGVATSLGVLLGIAPLPVLIIFVLGIVIIWLSGYVSLASITGSALLPVLIVLFNIRDVPWLSVLLTMLLGMMIIWKHRANIGRLRAGNEKRWFEKKPAHPQPEGESK